MPSEEQKRLWREEKEQQLRDKSNQPLVVRRKPAALSFGTTKKPKKIIDTAVSNELPSDAMLRKNLGL